MALLGTGTVARGQFEALQAELQPATTTVWSRRAESLQDFLEWAHPQAVQACASVEEAVEGAELIVVATSSAAPVLSGACLGKRGLLCGVGVNQARRRELDDVAVLRCERWIVDDLAQARLEAGDLLLTPGFAWEKVLELAAVINGPKERWEGWTGFKSLGVGCEDLATAALVYQNALALGLGVGV